MYMFMTDKTNTYIQKYIYIYHILNRHIIKDIFENKILINIYISYDFNG